MDYKEMVDRFNKWTPGRVIKDLGEYDVIPKLTPEGPRKKGAICGECGTIFEYGKAYGYCCTNNRCPTQMRAR